MTKRERLLIGVLVILMWSLFTVKVFAEPVSYWALYDTNWGGLNPSSSCTPTPAPGCGNAVTLGLMSGTNFPAGGPDGIDLITSIDTITGHINGTPKCGPFSSPYCANDLQTSVTNQSMPDGSYFAYRSLGTPSPHPWWVFFTVAGGVATVTPCGDYTCVPTTSRITSITSPTATTYVSNPVTFSGVYDNIDTFDQVQFLLSNTTLGISVAMAPLTLPAVNGGGLTFSTSRSLPFEGSYTVQERLYDTGTGSTTPYTSSVAFGLGTTTVGTTTAAIGAPAPAVCALLDIGCYVRNALVWAFFPDQNLVQQVALDGAQIKTRPPVGYVFSTITAIQGLSASSTPAFALAEDWPIMHYIFQPLAIGLAALFWFFSGLWFFLHIRHIQI